LSEVVNDLIQFLADRRVLLNLDSKLVEEGRVDQGGSRHLGFSGLVCDASFMQQRGMKQSVTSASKKIFAKRWPKRDFSSLSVVAHSLCLSDPAFPLQPSSPSNVPTPYICSSPRHYRTSFVCYQSVFFLPHFHVLGSTATLIYFRPERYLNKDVSPPSL